MDTQIVSYLRDTAEKCARFARSCPHPETAHGLEEIATDLMAKALEIEEHFKLLAME